MKFDNTPAGAETTEFKRIQKIFPDVWNGWPTLDNKVFRLIRVRAVVTSLVANPAANVALLCASLGRTADLVPYTTLQQYAGSKAVTWVPGNVTTCDFALRAGDRTTKAVGEEPLSFLISGFGCTNGVATANSFPDRTPFMVKIGLLVSIMDSSELL
jgi:hypothetical protein